MQTALTATTFGLADAMFVIEARTGEARHGSAKEGSVHMANGKDG
jgi:hypothetical protein